MVWVPVLSICILIISDVNPSGMKHCNLCETFLVDISGFGFFAKQIIIICNNTKYNLYGNTNSTGN